MGCCQAKEANQTISMDANCNLQNGSKKDEEQNKATVATASQNIQPPKENPAVEESMAKDHSSLRNGKKKKKTADFDPNAFSQDLLNEINLFRSNPKRYVEKIRSHIPFIKEDKDKLMYHNGEIKTVLNKGITSFNGAIEILNNTSPLGSLELTDEIKIDVPDDPEIQTKSYSSLQSQLKAKYPGKKLGFTLDLGAPNPEVIVVLQLVDDNKNNGNRRNVLMDNGYLHLGVSIKKGKSKHYAIYLTFSD